jgi:hypothetical protein
MPNNTLRLLSLAAACSVAACSSEPSAPAASTASVRVVNAGVLMVNVLVDGQSVLNGLQVASVSNAIPVSAGTHQVRLQYGNGVSSDVTVNAAAGKSVTAVAASMSQSSVSASVLEDTGSVVPAGKSKLRVAHLAGGNHAIEFWRTQPDFQTPVHIMTPFVYQATSPYLQSDPGNWEVFVTAPGGGAKLATTGAVNVPSGERRTVVLLDSAGTLRFRVITD